MVWGIGLFPSMPLLQIHSTHSGGKMFQKIRNRLLISNLFVFTLVLAGFGLAVRVVFVHNLKQQLTNRLIVLGQAAIANAEIENGQLKVEEGFLTQELQSQQQAIEWFDATGNLIVKRGKYRPNSALNPAVTVATSPQSPAIKSVTLPILIEPTGKRMGYVRVSEQLEEFDETVLQLDIGLGAGVLLAIVLSGVGSVWLNQQAMQPINESFRRLKQFTADASHELRNPLMAISSNVEVALKYSKGMRPDDRDVMTVIASATDQMIQLTEDLLLLARMDKPSPTQQTSVNLSDLLNAIVQLYRFQAEKKQITLTVIVAMDLYVRGDSASLTRAFTNLLQNAIFYTPEGGAIRLGAARLGHQIEVTVNDTGVGIAAADLDRIFERFWRADQSRTFNQGGGGLGLAITQAIIQQHRGNIAVTSQLGTGTSFTVQLPLQMH